MIAISLCYQASIVLPYHFFEPACLRENKAVDKLSLSATLLCSESTTIRLFTGLLSKGGYGTTNSDGSMAALSSVTHPSGKSCSFF
jgi:hypothetical protein